MFAPTKRKYPIVENIGMDPSNSRIFETTHESVILFSLK